MADEPKIYDDVPRSAAIVRSQKEVTALARKMAGEELPDECRYSCVTCGWDKTLKFEDAEIAALDNDLTNYTGPCPQCGNMTLVPFARLLGEDVGNIYASDKKRRLEENGELADVFVNRVKQEIAGTVFDGPAQDPAADEIHDPRGPQDYPDAGDVDRELKPR